MEKSIGIVNPIDKSKLKANDYLRTLINEGVKEGLLSDFHTEKIQTGLIEILNSICMKISEKGNSSMRMEDAEEIATSIMYTLSVILKASPTPEAACERLKSENIEDLFYEGKQEIVSFITRARGKWAVITKELFETKNVYYNSTVCEGMKAFFQNYNYETAAHNNIITCDYPLCVESSEEIGIEFILSYLTNFKIENDFLLKFSEENVHDLLCFLDKDLKKAGFAFEKEAYSGLPINIFIYVFACALALEFCNKDPFTLKLTKKDVNKITEHFKETDYGDVVRTLDALAGKLSFEISADEEMRDYLRKAVRILASEISGVKSSTLTGIFICSEETDSEVSFDAEETEDLSDSEYRFLISQAEQCDNEDKKLEIIKENFRNADDFADAVKDLKLTKAQILNCLSSFDMAENLRLFKRYNIFSYCLNDEDKYVKEILETYVSSLDKNDKALILKLISLMK